jgi:hypothetical protein
MGVVAATAVAYFLLFELSDFLFGWLRFSETANWIFLPSGLRLVFVLIFVEAGAIGIVVATTLIGLTSIFNGDVITALGAGAISGFAPWMARLICLDLFELDVNLQHLHASTLLKASVLFAILSAVLHQIWFSWRGQTPDFFSSTAVMAVGDWVGTMAVLYAAKFLLLAYRPARAE